MTEKLPFMQVLAPAKINLALRILKRRNDGFHEIETMIAPISLCDELKIAKEGAGQGIDFRCDDKTVPEGAENLVVRAAQLFFDKTKLKPDVSIELKKKIPHGAGLGGGSSDAAATFLGLNELFGTSLSRDELAEMAASIGSDVPFFLFQSAAFCSGRGEVVKPQKLPTQLFLLLLKPEFSVSTPWAYRRWQESIPEINYDEQEFAGHRFVNHLERPVFEKFVFLALLKMWLRRQPEIGAALMSGSGSTIFAVLKDPKHAEAVADRAKSEFDPKLWTCACHTI